MCLCVRVATTCTRQLELADDIGSFFEKGDGFQVAHNLSCILLEDMFEAADAAIRDVTSGPGSPSVDGVLRFAHAETMMPFVALLVRGCWVCRILVVVVVDVAAVVAVVVAAAGVAVVVVAVVLSAVVAVAAVVVGVIVAVVAVAAVVVVDVAGVVAGSCSCCCCCCCSCCCCCCC